jgi:photosynthetic reaction center cytochrome c subunit
MRLLLFLLLTSAAVFAQQPPEGAPRRQPPPPPKNLKLLPPENLIRVMQGYRTSLGVQCTHCHVQGDFASDDNPKKGVALKMIALVKDINAKLPEGKGVTCFTCHRGAVEPVSAIPAPPPPPQRPPQ